MRIVVVVAMTFIFQWASQSEAAPQVNRLFLGHEPSPLIEMIAVAKKTIDIEIYTMGSKTVRRSLRDAIHRGVKIRILKDPNPLEEGCSLFSDDVIKAKGGYAAAHAGGSKKKRRGREPKKASLLDCDDQRKLVKEIVASGGRFEAFNKSLFCGDPKRPCYQHGKVAVVDRGTSSQKALISTGNFEASNLCLLDEKPKRCNRDYHVVSSDRDVVESLMTTFDSDINGVKYDLRSRLGNQVSKKVTVSPHSLSPIVAFIESAKSSVRIQNQYIHDKHLIQALIDSAKKGRQVSVQVASICAFRKPKAADIKKEKKFFQTLESVGAKVRFFTSSQKIHGRPGYLHAKAIVVDDARGWVGSVNGSQTSLSSNREFGIFFEDPDAVKKLRDQMAADFSDAASENFEESSSCKKDRRTERSIDDQDL